MSESRNGFRLIKFLKVLTGFTLIFLTILIVVLINKEYFFPPDNVGDNSIQFVKLHNPSNYCYINSLMQYLYNLDDFRKLVLDTDKSDKDMFAKLQDIFRKMDRFYHINLTQDYNQLIDIFKTKYSSSAFEEGRMGCSFEALSFIIFGLIREETGDKEYSLSINYETVKNSEVAKMFLFNQPDILTPFKYIEDKRLANNIQSLFDEDSSLKEPLPKHISIFLAIRNKKNEVVNSATLVKEITILGHRYKFNGYIHRTTAGCPHITLFLYRNNKFIHLNDSAEAEVKKAVFGKNIPGVTGLFYSRM